MPYLTVKEIHVACGLLALVLLTARLGADALRGPGAVARLLGWTGWAAWLGLGTTALWLMQLTRQNPVQHGWLAAKVAALAALLLAAWLAQRAGRRLGPRPARALGVGASLGLAVFILSVAASREPAGFLAFLSP